jgi:lipopolysaccharide/colanic/teichoic acid biosynthesis glycosyltransferase
MLLEDKTGNQDGFAEAVNSASPLKLCSLAARLIALVSGAVCLALLAPVLLLAAVAIRLDSNGPIFVRETRYGYRNRTIEVRKFRVKTPSPEGEPLLTSVGQILRQTGIEELPMLVNVISGEMSIIGPPPSAHRTALLNKRKPGITRWAEVFSTHDRASD